MNCDDKIISIYDTNFNAQGLTLPVGPISMRLNYNTELHTIASAISGHNCKISIQKAIASMHIDPERESEFDRVEPHSFYKTCNNFKGTNNMQPNQSNNMVFATYGLQDWIVNKLTGQNVRSNCGLGFKSFWEENEGFHYDLFDKVNDQLSDVVREKVDMVVVVCFYCHIFAHKGSSSVTGSNKKFFDAIATSRRRDSHQYLNSIALPPLGQASARSVRHLAVPW
jgi:hypothetical protein